MNHNQGGSIGPVRLTIALLFSGTVVQTSAPIIDKQVVQEPVVSQQQVQQKEQPQPERKVKPKKAKPEQEKPKPVAKPVEQVEVVTPPPPVITGNKETWLRASGIPENLWVYVDAIVTRESGWNPCAYYPGQSDCSAQLNGANVACGLVQTLPCGKAGADWTDPVAALKWQYGYVNSRYGGYPQAVEFWNANHWY